VVVVVLVVVVVVVLVAVVDVGVVAGVALAVDDVVGVVLVAGWHFAVTFVAPGGTPGIDAGGVFGAASLVIVTGAPPPGGVYVTAHTTVADATALPATPHTPSTKPTAIIAIFSL
jgi:hypothetical protein